MNGLFSKVQFLFEDIFGGNLNESLPDEACFGKKSDIDNGRPPPPPG